MLRKIAIATFLIAGGLLAWAQAKSTGCFCSDCDCTNCQGGCADVAATAPCCRQAAKKTARPEDCFCAKCQCADCDGACAAEASAQK